MSEHQVQRSQDAIPDQLLQIASEQEGGAERVISQIEVVQSSFEEIQTLTKECQEILCRLTIPSEELEQLISKMEEVAVHADNGMYNVSGAFDLFQYQDIVRQKLERVGHRLIDVSEYILANLVPQNETKVPDAGHGIIERAAQIPDVAKDDADAVVADFFAKLRAQKASKM